MLLRRFPWLSGVTVLDGDANVFASVPSIPLKQLDYTPLLTVPPKSSPRALRACAQDTPMGPEIILARPIMREAEPAGFFRLYVFREQRGANAKTGGRGTPAQSMGV